MELFDSLDGKTIQTISIRMSALNKSRDVADSSNKTI